MVCSPAYGLIEVNAPEDVCSEAGGDSIISYTPPPRMKTMKITIRTPVYREIVSNCLPLCILEASLALLAIDAILDTS
jgi:hypothetical protein